MFYSIGEMLDAMEKEGILTKDLLKSMLKAMKQARRQIHLARYSKKRRIRNKNIKFIQEG